MAYRKQGDLISPRILGRQSPSPIPLAGIMATAHERGVIEISPAPSTPRINVIYREVVPGENVIADAAARRGRAIPKNSPLLRAESSSRVLLLEQWFEQAA